MCFTSSEEQGRKTFEKFHSQIRIRKVFQQFRKPVGDDVKENPEIGRFIFLSYQYNPSFSFW